MRVGFGEISAAQALGTGAGKDSWPGHNAGLPSLAQTPSASGRPARTP